MRRSLTQQAVRLLVPVLLSAPVALCQTATSQQLRAQALVDKQQAFVGEPITLQIRIEGSDSPQRPDLGAIAGFTVQDLGGQQNSSESVTIINGRMTRVVSRGYIFSYRLTPTKAGNLTIPSVAVAANGATLRTRPVSIRAVPPTETEDFKLRISLSESKAYVGQPVTMTVTWYVGKDVRDFSFNLPVIQDARFDIADLKARGAPDNLLRIPLVGQQAVAEKGRGTLDGKEYLTVRFRKALIPKQAGRLTLPQASVSGRALQGYQQNRRRSVFDDPFGNDPFGFGRRAVYENFVVPSNRPVLQVEELPRAGRPADFSGLVGRYKIAVQATPTEMNVGDPITLTLRISGPSYLDNVELPPLENQAALARDFKIPQEMAAGVVEGGAKSFTQTIRPNHSDVREIPPVELSYFDPETGRYATAATAAIPLTVKGTRILTARDAEGLPGAGAIQSGIESREGGIGHNYEGPDVLVDQAFGPNAWLRSPAWLVALGVPPLVYFGLLGFVLFVRWKEADPAARRARRAFRQLSKDLGSLKAGNTDEYYSAVLEALRRYLGGKLALPAGAVTFADVRPSLEQRGVDEETIRTLGQLFERCEAGRYAGVAFGDQEPSALAQTAREIARKLERSLQ